MSIIALIIQVHEEVFDHLLVRSGWHAIQYAVLVVGGAAVLSLSEWRHANFLHPIRQVIILPERLLNALTQFRIRLQNLHYWVILIVLLHFTMVITGLERPFILFGIAFR